MNYIELHVIINACFLINQIIGLFPFFVFKDMLPGLYRTCAVPRAKNSKKVTWKGFQVECCEVCIFFLLRELRPMVKQVFRKGFQFRQLYWEWKCLMWNSHYVAACRAFFSGTFS